MQLSAYTLMMIIKAVQRDIARFEELSQREDVSEEEAGDYAEYALDMSRSLSEICQAYEEARVGETQPLPSAEELMKHDNWAK